MSILPSMPSWTPVSQTIAALREQITTWWSLESEMARNSLMTCRRFSADYR
jgi:hypothetical protein